MVVNREFAEFLKSRRQRLRVPNGLAAHRRRRVSGLRREEVAQRANISVEWYTKLEQGRVVSPSEATLSALVEALELDDLEARHLRSLIKPHARSPFTQEVVPKALSDLIAHLTAPAYVTGKMWDLLDWNTAADELFLFSSLPDEQRNILLILINPAAKALFGETWNLEARRVVSLFRRDYSAWAGDPSFERLVDKCKAGCREFEGWWLSHDIGAPVSGTKSLHVPNIGRCTYAYSSFQSNDDPALKLALYTKIS